jgi:colicin import membrane protein
MAEQQKESSVLFSLKELMNLEEDRIREEEAQKEAQAKAALEAKLAAERAARQAEEARLRSEEEARRQEEVRRKEDAMRLEAIKMGELEKARAEAEHRARMQAMSAQQAHEQTLAALTQDKHKKRLQIIVGIAVGILLVGGVGGGIAFKQHQDEAAKRALILENQRKETEERLRRLQADFDMANRKEQELQASLANAKDEATRAKLQAELEAQKKATAAAKGAIRGGSGSGTPSKTKTKNCSPGDPLCD